MSHCTFYREREDGNYDYVKKNLDDDTEVVIRVLTPTEYEESQRPSSETAAADNRISRNSYLEETDWWCVSDRTPTTAELNYRQALRDITTHDNWPFLQASDWPTKPSQMIDPASAIAIATTAFTGIKKAVAAGKEISQLGKDISAFGRAVSDLDYMGNKAKDPPLWRKLDPKFDTSAIEIWAAQQRAKEMREELREHISLYYGPSAWEQIVHIEAEQRRMQKEAVYRRQEKIDNLINWIIGIVLVVTGLGIFVAVVWFIGKSQGRW